MIIKFKSDAKKDETESLRKALIASGFEIHEILGASINIFGVIGDSSKINIDSLYAYECVENIIRIQEPYKQANRKFHPDNTIVNINGIEIGGKNIVIMAGPCAVESESQINAIAKIVSHAGAKILRGGSYKPRTSPYSFQGIGAYGLDILKKAGMTYNMPIISEVLSIDDLPVFLNKVDILQVGARNMQNFSLLKELGKTDIPILLKRGQANTIEEWLMASEYILAGGNKNVILCERGIRTFEAATRFTLDISAISVIKKYSHLPIIIDPSHAAGRWEYVESLAKAAVAAGADGLIIEVHNEPDKALSDGQQSLKPERFVSLMKSLKKIAIAIDRNIE